MSVKGRRIEYHGHSRIPICARVAMPQVPVNQGWSDGATARLQRAQQTRNHLVEERPRQLPDLFTGAASLLLQLQQGPRGPGEVLLPRVGPAVLDRDLPVEGGGVEAEPAAPTIRRR